MTAITTLSQRIRFALQPFARSVPRILTLAVLATVPCVYSGCGGNPAPSSDQAPVRPEREDDSTPSNVQEASAKALEISKATTYWTEPLDEHGMVDYIQVINRIAGEGVDANDNAAAVLLGILRSGGEIPKKQQTRAALLSVEPPSGSGPFFTPFTGEAERLGEYHTAKQRPWARREFPQLAEWVDANAPIAPVLKAAAQKKSFFIPREPFYAPKLKNSLALRKDATLEEEFSGILEYVTIRTMLSLGEGRPKEALEHLSILDDLAHSLGRGLLGGARSRSYVCFRLRNIPAHSYLIAMDPFTSEEYMAQYRRMGSMTGFIPDRAILARSIASWRAVVLESIVDTAQGYAGPVDMAVFFDRMAWSMGVSGDPAIQHLRKAVELADWNAALRTTNEWFDRLQKAAECDEFAQTNAHLTRLAADFRKWEEGIAVEESKELTAETAGALIASTSLSPVLGFGVRSEYEEMAQTECLARMVRLAYAVAAYAANHKRHYPASLDELIPDYLQEIPADPFTGRPIAYQLRKNGFSLSSLGADGKQNDPDGRFRHVLGNIDIETMLHDEEYRETEEGDDMRLIIRRDPAAEEANQNVQTGSR